MPDEPDPKLNITGSSATADEGGAAVGAIGIGGNFTGNLIVGGAGASSVPSLLPTPPSPPAHFTGRETELDRLETLLTSGENVAITAIQGMGGIGKTALARKLAERLKSSFPGGVLWWSLGPQPDLLTALEVWAYYANPGTSLVALPTLESRSNIVRSMLAKLGRLCAIIDDAWQAEAVRVLISALPPDCPALITTRDGDLAKALRCKVERIDTLSEDEGVTMIAKLLGSLEDYEPIAHEISSLCEGLPLALELIAGLADLPADLPTLAMKLKEKPALDILKMPGGEKREENVEACLAMSYATLNVDMQRRFRALGVFAPGLFTRTAIATVWNEKLDDTVEQAIRYLVRRSLLIKDKETEEYRIHALLRAYALALLERSNESDIVARRHANYYQRISEELNWSTVPTAIEQIELSWDWVRRNAPDRIIQYLLELALGASRFQSYPRGDRETDGMLLNNIGYAYHTLGHSREALAYYEQALSLHRELNDRIGEGIALNNIGFAHYSLGHQLKALSYLQQALATRRQVRDSRGESVTLNNMAAVYVALGRQQEALEHYRQALTICYEIGNHRDKGIILNNSATLNSYLDHGQDALEAYRRSLALLDESDDYWVETIALANVITLLEKMNRTTEMMEYLERAILLKEKIGHPDLESDRAKLEELRRKIGGR